MSTEHPLAVGRSSGGLEILVKLCGGHLLADGNVVLSPEEARGLARRLIDAASEAELAARLAREHAGPVGHGG